jgi:hypothetical protein
MLKGIGNVSDKKTTNDNEVVSHSDRSRHRAGAGRTARWRDRRQRGFKVYQIEVCDADIDQLIRRGLLDRLQRHDGTAVERAIGIWLDQLGR